MKQQQVFGEFSKAAHTWQKRVFELNLKHKIMNHPVFPWHILHPFVPRQSEDAAPSHIPEDELAPDSETKVTTSTQPLKKTGKSSPSKKGKDKVTEPVSKTEDESDFEATPSPSPTRKKRKTEGAAKKRRTTLTDAAISHYYSSSDEEEQPSSPM